MIEILQTLYQAILSLNLHQNVAMMYHNHHTHLKLSQLTLYICTKQMYNNEGMSSKTFNFMPTGLSDPIALKRFSIRTLYQIYIRICTISYYYHIFYKYK